jgi:hypothetical protein
MFQLNSKGFACAISLAAILILSFAARARPSPAVPVYSRDPSRPRQRYRAACPYQFALLEALSVAAA